MIILKTISKTAVAVVTVMFAASAGWAHMVWLVPEKAQGPKAMVIFSDNLAPDDSSALMDKVTRTELSSRDAAGKAAPLAWKRANRRFDVNVPGKGPRMAGGTSIYGVTTVRKATDVARLLYYHPHTILWNPDRDALSAAPWDKLTMQIVPMFSGNSTRFKVLYKGEPLAGSEVAMQVPEGERHMEMAMDEHGDTFLTDADGMVELKFHKSGIYGVRARHTEKKKGEFDGKAYAEIRHYATLTLAIGKKHVTPEEPPFPRTLTDAKGHTVKLAAKPMRIASLTLGTDENLMDLIDPRRLVAMTAVSRMDDISNVANRAAPGGVVMIEKNWEKVKELNPDLVLAATYTKELADPLIAAGLPVYQFSEFHSIKALRENLITLGRLTGEEDKVAKILAEWESTLKTARQKKWPKPIRAVYFSEGRISGALTVPSDVVKAAGLVDAAAEFGIEGNVKATPKLIANLNPDVILIGEDSDKAKDETLALFRSPDYQVIAAAAAGRIYAIPGKHITTVSWNVVKAVEDVQSALELMRP